MAIKGHDQRTDQPVLKGATNDLSSLMKLPHTALDHLDVVRVASTEIHFGPIFLSWDVRVPPDLEEFDNTLEMYRLDTGVIVRRSHVKLQGAPQPRLIITAPNFGLWQVTRLRIVRNP